MAAKESQLQDRAGEIAKKLQANLKSDAGNIGQSSAEGALARGRVFAVAAYTDEAIESFGEAMALDSKCYEAAARLVLARIRKNQPKEALAIAMKLAVDAPDYELSEMTSNESISVYTILGNALVLNERVEDAIEAYEAATRVSKRDTTAPARLAQLYLATGKPENAVEQAPRFKDNSRFRNLSGVLSLGATSMALLPRFEPGSIAGVMALDAHGRPLLVNGCARVASVASGNGEWCAKVPDVLPDQP